MATKETLGIGSKVFSPDGRMGLVTQISGPKGRQVLEVRFAGGAMQMIESARLMDHPVAVWAMRP